MDTQQNQPPVATPTPAPAPVQAAAMPAAQASGGFGLATGIVVVLLLAAAAGGAYYYYMTVLGPQMAEQKAALEAASMANEGTQEDNTSLEALEAELNASSESELDAEVTNLENTL